jgi:hypothetical protein
MERQHYIWSAGRDTLQISLSAVVIARLRAEAATQMEVGGLLLGRRDSDQRICIQDFELVSSEHRRGIPFTLSGNDKRRFGQRIRARRRELQILGSFRTHLRQGLYMDQYDFELMSEYLAGPSDVMLLVRPADWQAGFFIWDEGDIFRQKSFKEFPFDPAVLPLVDEEPELIPVPTPNRRLPTLMRASLIAGTAGMAAVLAFYTHGAREHRYPRVVHASVSAPRKPSQFDAAPNIRPVYPPIDTDVASNPDDPYELHVKLPNPDASKPKPVRTRRDTAGGPLQPPAPKQPPVAVQPAPLPAPAIQTAGNTTPPAVAAILARPVLKPLRPTLISEVSLEPAQPGVLRRGLHHVPVLNLFGKHTYKSGDDFSPASPVREVKPQLSQDTTQLAAVDVKIWINDKGDVTKTELITDHVPPEVADVASTAANKWKFKPARLSDRPVSSEVVMHFRFVPKQNY